MGGWGEIHKGRKAASRASAAALCFSSRRLWMRYTRRAALAAQVLQLSMPVSWRGSGQPPELPDTYSTYVSDLRSL